MQGQAGLELMPPRERPIPYVIKGWGAHRHLALGTQCLYSFVIHLGRKAGRNRLQAVGVAVPGTRQAPAPLRPCSIHGVGCQAEGPEGHRQVHQGGLGQERWWGPQVSGAGSWPTPTPSPLRSKRVREGDLQPEARCGGRTSWSKVLRQPGKRVSGGEGSDPCTLPRLGTGKHWIQKPLSDS